MNEMFNSFLENYQSLNIFGNQIFEVPIERCHIAPNHMKCRAFDRDYAAELKDSFFGYSSINFRKSMCFLVPIKWDPTTNSSVSCPYMGTPLAEPPTEYDIIHHCHFWILGGQHTIMAYKAILEENDARCKFWDDLREVTAIMFWAPNNMKSNVTMMGLSRALNNMQETRLDEQNFPLVASQTRAVWKEFGCPRKESALVKGSKWKVKPNFKILLIFS